MGNGLDCEGEHKAMLYVSTGTEIIIYSIKYFYYDNKNVAFNYLVLQMLMSVQWTMGTVVRCAATLLEAFSVVVT